MSAPVDTAGVGRYAAIQNALCELVSAESSLNMYPERIKPEVAGATDASGRVAAGPGPQYLSVVDANAKHALEHLHAAFRLMNMAHHDQESLKTQVYKLVVQLRELGVAPGIKTWLDDE